MRIIAYSKAMYSTWLYLETLKLMVDAGEGLNTHLEGRLLGLQSVALTHGHTDHFTGLMNIFITRLRYHKDVQPLPPVAVYWPEGDEEIAAHLDYLGRTVLGRHPELARIEAVRPGMRLPLTACRGLTLEPFAVRHRDPHPSLGYRVLQERWRLKPELLGTPQRELNTLAQRHGKEGVAESHEAPLVVIGGDGLPMDPSWAEGGDLLVHEATFLDDPPEGGHSSLSQALGVWRKSAAARLLIYHISSRYTPTEVAAALDAALPNPEERARVDFVAPGRLFSRELRLGGL